jgi:hypothetical protein
MLALLPLLQVATAALWLVPVLLTASAVLRTIHGTGSKQDAMWGPTFINGLVQIGFTARWMLWGHTLSYMSESEISAWSALYASSCMVAVYASLVVHAASRRR